MLLVYQKLMVASGQFRTFGGVRSCGRSNDCAVLANKPSSGDRNKLIDLETDAHTAIALVRAGANLSELHQKTAFVLCPHNIKSLRW